MVRRQREIVSISTRMSPEAPSVADPGRPAADPCSPSIAGLDYRHAMARFPLLPEYIPISGLLGGMARNGKRCY